MLLMPGPASAPSPSTTWTRQQRRSYAPEDTACPHANGEAVILQARACIDLCILETYSSSCLEQCAPCCAWLAETCQLPALPLLPILCERQPCRFFLPLDTSVMEVSIIR